MPVRVVVVTDRTLAAEALAPRVAAIVRAVPPGSVLIQIREKDLDGGPLLALTRAILEVARPAGAPVWVNDRVDVALIAGADGVHLPEHGLSIEDARATAAAVGRPLAIGCSRHTPDGVRAAARAGAELVQFGPVWSTPNKGAPIGVEALAIGRALAGAAADLAGSGHGVAARLVAVGGIDGPARARHAALAGADAVAVIRAAWHAGPEMVASLVGAVEAGISAR